MNPDEHAQDGIVTDTPEILLSFTDDEINQVIDDKISKSKSYYEAKNISKRRSDNYRYWKGDQLDKTARKNNERGYINNIIHRDTETQIKNATSRMPDIIAMSPSQANDSPDSKDIKQKTSKVEGWLNIRLTSDRLKRLSKNSLRDNRIKFIGVWKIRFDFGIHDIVIDRVRPEDVLIDHTARIPEDGFTSDNCEFIVEYLDEPVSVIMAKFPEKAEELKARVSVAHYGGKEVPASSKVKYEECWATMYDKEGSPHEIVFWRYDRIVLKKMETPYYDNLQEKMPEVGGVKRNFFNRPRKPYIFFSGENTGLGPLDDTNPLEISIPLQDTVNKRGQQISDINDWSIPKMVINGNAMSEQKASNITRDPSEVIYLNDEVQDVREAISSIVGLTASPALYNDLQAGISAIDAHFSTNPVSRGETVTQESGLSKQISREGDLSSADDLAQTMIQRAIEEAANWYVHLGKMFGTKPMSATSPGGDGKVNSVEITHADIPDDLQLVIRVNAIDKATQRSLSMDMARMKAIDPYTFFENLDYPNPKELSIRLLDYLSGQADGFARYKADIGAEMFEPAGGATESESPGAAQPQDPQQPIAPPVPQNQ